jgi:hypothetical protein
MTQKEFLDYAFTIIKSQLQYENRPYKIDESSTTEDIKTFWVSGERFCLFIPSDDSVHTPALSTPKAKKKLNELGTILLSELQWGDDQVEADFDLDSSSITSCRAGEDWKYSTPEYSIILALATDKGLIIEKERERF